MLQQGEYAEVTRVLLALRAGADLASLASGQRQRNNPHCNNTSTAVKSQKPN